VQALAYVNWGRWVADCPHPECTDAREVSDGRDQDVCHFGHPFTVVRPPAAAMTAIMAELTKRTEDADRSWYPRGHLRARLAGQPTGQTLDELREETRRVELYRREQRADRSAQLAALLSELGVSVGPDGEFSGRL
jgi:hypothetical protein